MIRTLIKTCTRFFHPVQNMYQAVHLYAEYFAIEAEMMRERSLEFWEATASAQTRPTGKGHSLKHWHISTVLRKSIPKVPQHWHISTILGSTML